MDVYITDFIVKQGATSMNTMTQQEIDAQALTELRLFIDNDSDLYKTKAIPCILNIKRKIQADKFLPSRAPLLFKYLVDAGAKKYCEEFGGTLRTTFPSYLRWKLAEDYAIYYATEIRLGNY
jgi:hypothetical protein